MSKVWWLHCGYTLSNPQEKDLGREQLKERVEEEGKQQIGQLEQRTLLLGIVASVAPMLGLLGTVLGMIITFDEIEAVGMGEISALAGGISQALITTFAGLSVGIPALLHIELF